jgi:hypothetical protein
VYRKYSPARIKLTIRRKYNILFTLNKKDIGTEKKINEATGRNRNIHK